MDDLSLPPPSHTAQSCANCGAERIGPWCHDCGQHREATHRSVRRLGLEALEHLINTDGKILSTLKRLFTHPARLTKAYLEGHRVAQVAPINLFLVILVLFLFIAGQTTHVEIIPPSAAQAAEIPRWMRWTIPISNVLHQHAASFTSNLSESAELFGLLTVPVAALLLWGLFAFPRRGFRLFDHLIFALHSLSFQFIILAAIQLLPDSLGILALPLLVIMPAHLFFHMRGTYGGGVWATLLRMALLGAGTAVASFALVALWMSLAYAELWI